MKEKVDLILQDVQKLPTISAVVSKVLAMVNSPDVDINALASEISKDPSITAAVIKLSNSAYYRASKPVRTISEALMTLGTKTVKEIILLSAAKGVLHKDLGGYQMDGDQIWMHSLIVAELSSRIALGKKLPIPKDLAFTAGLLIDAGKLVLNQFFSPVMFKLREELKTSQEPFYDVEKKYFGYNHMEISNILLTKWNFPPELIDVVTNYNTPELSQVNPVLVSVVHIANTMAVVGGIGIDLGGISVPLSKFALEKTGVNEKDMETYFMHLPELEKHIAELLHF